MLRTVSYASGRLAGVLFAAALMAGSAVSAGAQISIFNTGQSSTATPLAGGTIDLHYTIVNASTGA